MFIVQIFRQEVLPEFDGATEEFEYRRENPFEGIEIIGFSDTEDGVNEIINEYQEKFPKALFHYEQARDVTFVLPGELDEVELEESERNDS